MPGVYRYTVDSEWNGYKALVPGMPKEGGEIYVIDKDRPANAPALTFNLPPIRNSIRPRAPSSPAASTAGDDQLRGGDAGRGARCRAHCR